MGAPHDDLAERRKRQEVEGRQAMREYRAAEERALQNMAALRALRLAQPAVKKSRRKKSDQNAGGPRQADATV